MSRNLRLLLNKESVNEYHRNYHKKYKEAFEKLKKLENIIIT